MGLSSLLAEKSREHLVEGLGPSESDIGISRSPSESNRHVHVIPASARPDQSNMVPRPAMIRPGRIPSSVDPDRHLAAARTVVSRLPCAQGPVPAGSVCVRCDLLDAVRSVIRGATRHRSIASWRCSSPSARPPPCSRRLTSGSARRPQESAFSRTEAHIRPAPHDQRLRLRTEGP